MAWYVAVALLVVLILKPAVYVVAVADVLETTNGDTDRGAMT